MSNTIENDYQSAHIRTAIYRDGDKKYLIFASVELCPNELRLPVERSQNRLKIQRSKNRYIELNVFPDLEVSDALDWYLLKKDDVLPSFINFENIESLFEPPIFPNLSYSTSKCPFAPDWANDSRTSRKVPLQEPSITFSGLKDEISKAVSIPHEKRTTLQTNLTKAHSGIIDFCGFDPFTYVDFLQNIVLIAPNPIFRKFFWNPIKNANNQEVDIFFSIEPRDKIELTELQISLFEHRGESIANSCTKILSKNETSFEWKIGREVSQISWKVICPVRGLISKPQPHGLIKRTTLKVNPITASRSFKIPKTGTRKPEQTITTSVHAKPIISEIGEAPDPNSPLRVLLPRQMQRDIFLRSNHNKQFIFHKDPLSAQNTVRSLLASAQERLIIIDPYFGNRELGIYGYANGQYGVIPQVLTGAEFLKNDYLNLGDDGPWMNCNPRISNGDALNITVQENISSLQVSIKVMRGEKPVIHDRFLIVDDAIWMLGPSLNEIGERLGVLAQLQDSDELNKKLLEIWNQCPTLLEWLNGR